MLHHSHIKTHESRSQCYCALFGVFRWEIGQPSISVFVLVADTTNAIVLIDDGTGQAVIAVSFFGSWYDCSKICMIMLIVNSLEKSLIRIFKICQPDLYDLLAKCSKKLYWSITSASICTYILSNWKWRINSCHFDISLVYTPLVINLHNYCLLFVAFILHINYNGFINGQNSLRTY